MAKKKKLTWWEKLKEPWFLSKALCGHTQKFILTILSLWSRTKILASDAKATWPTFHGSNGRDQHSQHYYQPKLEDFQRGHSIDFLFLGL